MEAMLPQAGTKHQTNLRTGDGNKCTRMQLPHSLATEICARLRRQPSPKTSKPSSRSRLPGSPALKLSTGLPIGPGVFVQQPPVKNMHSSV